MRNHQAQGRTWVPKKPRSFCRGNQPPESSQNPAKLSDNPSASPTNPTVLEDWINRLQFDSMQSFLDEFQEKQLSFFKLLVTSRESDFLQANTAQGLYNPSFSPGVYQSYETGGEINSDSEPFIRSYPGDTMTGLMTLKLGTKPGFPPQQLHKQSIS